MQGPDADAGQPDLETQSTDQSASSPAATESEIATNVNDQDTLLEIPVEIRKLLQDAGTSRREILLNSAEDPSRPSPTHVRASR